MDDELVWHVSKKDEDELLREAAEESGFQKMPYRSVFYNPNGELPVGFSDDYYAAAKAITERILAGHTFGDYEGTAALFLFRHYLELALKGVVFNLRWLDGKNKNVPQYKSVNWSYGHELDVLWDEMKGQFPKKMGAKLWRNFDTDFLEKCVSEFHSVDPDGERFRYRMEKRGPARDPLKALVPSWPDLLRMMEHAHNVLKGLESYLIETYEQNEEWQDEMNSW